MILFVLTLLAHATCPDGATMHSGDGCQICVDAAGFLHGTQELDRGATTWVAEHGQLQLQYRWRDGGGVVETRYRQPRREKITRAVCGERKVSWWEPREPPRAWIFDEQDELVAVLRYFGRQHRMYRRTEFGEDGEVAFIQTGRRWPVPDAHMRGHWTDGYFGRRDHGRWRYTDEDGRVENGRYLKGQPHGRWTVTDGKETVEVGHYRHGYPSGRWTCERADGSQVRGHYRKGERTGTWTWFDADGNEMEIVRYRRFGPTPRLQGRHYTGGLLNGQEVPHPCDEDAVLQTWGSESGW